MSVIKQQIDVNIVMLQNFAIAIKDVLDDPSTAVDYDNMAENPVTVARDIVQHERAFRNVPPGLLIPYIEMWQERIRQIERAELQWGVEPNTAICKCCGYNFPTDIPTIEICNNCDVIGF